MVLPCSFSVSLCEVALPHSRNRYAHSLTRHHHLSLKRSSLPDFQCFEDHCPTPALGFYEGNVEWAKARCRADAFSLLGFVYRKRCGVNYLNYLNRGHSCWLQIPLDSSAQLPHEVFVQCLASPPCLSTSICLPSSARYRACSCQLSLCLAPVDGLDYDVPQILLSQPASCVQLSGREPFHASIGADIYIVYWIHALGLMVSQLSRCCPGRSLISSARSTTTSRRWRSFQSTVRPRATSASSTFRFGISSRHLRPSCSCRRWQVCTRVFAGDLEIVHFSPQTHMGCLGRIGADSCMRAIFGDPAWRVGRAWLVPTAYEFQEALRAA